jgi:hypothetical protein
VATGHVGRWRIAGDLSLSQVCLRTSRRPWTNSPTPRCHMWLAFMRADGVNGTWVMCLNRASGKPGNIPEYVPLHWHRELCQCRPLFLPHSWDKMDKFFFYTKQGAATTADLPQQKLHEEVVNSTISLGHKPHLLQCFQGAKVRNWTPIQTLTARISWGDDWW